MEQQVWWRRQLQRQQGRRHWLWVMQQDRRSGRGEGGSWELRCIRRGCRWHGRRM